MKASIVRRLTLLTRGAGFFSIALGVLVLAGWAFDISWAISIHPSWIAMRANSAFCFLLAGVALLKLQRSHSSHIVRAFGAVIALVGTLSFLQYLLGVDFGIDNLILHHGIRGVGAIPAGRMAANTAVNFIFIGFALIFPDLEIRNRVRLAEIFSLLVGLLTLPSLIAYIYGANFHVALTAYVQMAVHTAVGFIVLALGILTLRPDRGLTRLFSSRYAGGAQARRLLPSIVLLPLAIGGISLIGNDLGLYDIRFAMTLTIMITISSLLHLAYQPGMLVDEFDRQREVAAEKLQSANIDLEAQIQKRTSELILAKKMAALGEMAGGIAHELNTPLTTLTLSTERLRTELEPYCEKLAGAYNTVDKMETTTDRMAQIVRGLLAFARDGSKDKKTAQNLLKIVSETLALCSQKFDAHGVKLVLDDVKTPVVVECRPAEFSHALLNLLSNAFDACLGSPSPEVRVQVKTLDSRVLVSVTDSGPGISNDVAEMMMQPFFTTKELGKGTGLGLSIAKGLIESHDGELFLDRTTSKTRFVINLPLSAHQI